jgi:hypothetical protein
MWLVLKRMPLAALLGRTGIASPGGGEARELVGLIEATTKELA